MAAQADAIFLAVTAVLQAYTARELTKIRAANRSQALLENEERAARTARREQER
jgi:hypothetical protein